MRINLKKLKDKKQLESIILVCVLVAASVMVIIPLTAPKAKAVTHLASAEAEDLAGAPYDMDGVAGDGHVLWANNEDHIINTDYIVESWMTLEIPNLNWRLGDPAENIIEFQAPGKRIDVDGTFITHPSPGFPAFTQWTCFTAGGFGAWEGLFFHNGSKGVFRHVRINNSHNGIVMEPGSSLLSPGIDGSRFEYIKSFGMQMDGVTGATNMANTDFYRRRGQPKTETGIGLEVANGELNLTSMVRFYSHGPGLSSLHIMNATVDIDGSFFEGYNLPGYSVFVEGGASSDTSLDNCDFQKGVADNHYIRSDGASILVSDSTFTTDDGQLIVIANDYGPLPADVKLRNPDSPGPTFDNTTINATGGSSVALQWYKDVYVEDPDSNLITGAFVRIKDRLDNPAQPPSKMTDATGWAKGFVVTELIQYQASRTNFNPFNISAENNTMFGYATPEEIIDRSMVNTIVVPFNPIPNIPPVVSYLDIVPGGVQTGLVTIEFMLSESDMVDDGNLSVVIEFWYSGLGWVSAVLDPISDPTTNLSNNTLYTVVWDSKDPSQLPGIYDTGVRIKITPYDRSGIGTPSEIGPFTLDNGAPQLVSGPSVTVIDDTALIEWTVHEPGDASVLYGFTLTSPVFTTETTGSMGSTSQSVQLTGLQPGRNYSFMLYSTDALGNKGTSSV
jgi:hypothetical protein